MGGNWTARRKPIHAQGEHAKSAQKGWNRDSNPKPSFCHKILYYKVWTFTYVLQKFTSPCPRTEKSWLHGAVSFAVILEWSVQLMVLFFCSRGNIVAYLLCGSMHYPILPIRGPISWGCTRYGTLFLVDDLCQWIPHAVNGKISVFPVVAQWSALITLTVSGFRFEVNKCITDCTVCSVSIHHSFFFEESQPPRDIHIFHRTRDCNIFPLWFIHQTLRLQYLPLFQCFFQQIAISTCTRFFFCLKSKISIFYAWWKFDERHLLDLLVYRVYGPAAWRNCGVNQYLAGNVRGDSLSKSGAKFVRLQFLISWWTYFTPARVVIIVAVVCMLF